MSTAVAPLAKLQPVTLKTLVATQHSTSWIWQDILRERGTLLLAALWKVGKSTFFGALLRHALNGGIFLGRALRPCRVLLLTEEAGTFWPPRLGEYPESQLLLPPQFLGKPTPELWWGLVDQLARIVEEYGIDLLVIDTLASWWYVDSENDAANVQLALLPLQQLPVTRLYVHHMRKAGGSEGTAARGSGALAAAVDCICEMRRGPTAPSRTLRFFSRYPETPPELDLLWDGTDYALASSLDISVLGVRLEQLMRDEPGLTSRQLGEKLEASGVSIRREDLVPHLRDGSGVKWSRTGGGVKGDPYHYFLLPSLFPPAEDPADE